MNEEKESESKGGEGPFIGVKAAKEMLGVSARTLRRWDEKGKVRTQRLESGRRIFNKQDLQSLITQKGSVSQIQRKKIIYCRVSSAKQSGDLDRQSEFLRSLYPDHDIIRDVGSGINFKRKGFTRILDAVIRGEIEEIVVSSKDRLCRFGIELCEWLFKSYSTKLIIQNREEDKSPDQELAEDLLTIIQVFSARYSGKRRYKSKKNQASSNPEAEESAS